MKHKWKKTTTTTFALNMFSKQWKKMTFKITWVKLNKKKKIFNKKNQLLVNIKQDALTMHSSGLMSSD